MPQVSREQWHAFVRQWPNRTVYRTGIVEPPQEIVEVGGQVVARIRLLDSYGEPNQYFVEAHDASQE